GGIALAVGMDVFSEPLQQGAEIPVGEFALKVGNLAFRRVEELGGDQVSYGICGEIANAATGPVDILQAAFGVVVGGNPQHFLHGLIPLTGQISHRQITIQESLFQLKPQDDVEVIGN